MRIQQLHYLEAIIEYGSINEAAKSLFITQPSLSAALKELESEMGVQIFFRTRTGVTLTEDGREFMTYARQILDQVDLLTTRYQKKPARKTSFSVSAQHYAFVVHAFVELIKEIGGTQYQFTLRETETKNILDDIANFKSELGVLYLNTFNEKVLQKLFKAQDLIFTPLFVASPHVFVSRNNPLSKMTTVNLADLAPYPYLSYEQGEQNSFYFAEEILSTRETERNIKVSDRATMFNFMNGLNGYTLASGIISSALNDDKIVAIPLNVTDTMTLGYLRHRQTELSTNGQKYLELLKEHIRGYGFTVK